MNNILFLIERITEYHLKHGFRPDVIKLDTKFFQQLVKNFEDSSILKWFKHEISPTASIIFMGIPIEVTKNPHCQIELLDENDIEKQFEEISQHLRNIESQRDEGRIKWARKYYNSEGRSDPDDK